MNSTLRVKCNALRCKAFRDSKTGNSHRVKYNNEVRRMIEFQIRRNHPERDEIGVKFAVARRFYMMEPQTLELIDLAEKSERNAIQ